MLGSGILCGVGLKLSLKSLQEISSAVDEGDGDQSSLIQDTSIGALNGLVSSLGMVCMAQNECGSDAMTTHHALASYALTGLITGTINGTINEVISTTHSADTEGDIQLFNVTKSGAMEMGSNLFTALGKATIFKSATDSEQWRWRESRKIDKSQRKSPKKVQFKVPLFQQRSTMKLFRFQRNRLLKSIWMPIE